MRYIVGFMMFVFALCGGGLCVAAVRELVRRILSVGRFERAVGIVVGVERKYSKIMLGGPRGSRVMNFPVITFGRPGGQVVTFRSEVGDGRKVSRYRIGQRLGVRYDPAGEFAPMLDTWSGMWLPSVMYVVAGIVFLFGAALIYVAFGERIFGR